MTKEEIRKLEWIARLKRERIARKIAHLQTRWLKSNYENCKNDAREPAK